METIKLTKEIIELNIYDMLKFHFINCKDKNLDYMYSEFDSARFNQQISFVYGLSYSTVEKITDYIYDNMTDDMGYIKKKYITLVKLLPFPEFKVSPRHKDKWYKFLKGYDEKIKKKL